MSIPRQVDKFISSLPPCPVALIGCRAGEESFDCCEYDIAVFAEKPECGQVISLEGQTVELVYLENPRHHIIELFGMKIARDDKTFTLASIAKELTEEKFKRALKAHGRKLLVSSLFCQSMAQQASEPVVSHMWTKIAAYRFISGAIAFCGKRPMQVHELEQARQLEASDTIAGGLAAALECIGLERATRPAIARSREALKELKAKEYDIDLVISKIEYLLAKQMISDCYYFIGKSAVENLAKRNVSFHRKYAKLVQLALDLTSDVQQMEKLRRSFFKAATAALGD